MEAQQGTRRTANIRVRGRAADVVARVMSATAHELNRVGYAAFRIEDVASLSGVNKTTIYRRWPNKADLVAHAVTAHFAETLGRPGGLSLDTGTLRGDLRASLFLGVDLSPTSRGMLRLVTERSAPEIEAITRRARAELQRMRVAIIERAVARGELPGGIDAELVVDLVSAPVQRALLFNQHLSASYVERVIDVVLAGAIATYGKPRVNRRASKRTGSAQRPLRKRRRN